jgi:hypothetical protein
MSFITVVDDPVRSSRLLSKTSREIAFMPNRIGRIVSVIAVLLFLRLATAASAEGIRTIAAAQRTTCAIRNDGALFCWGWSHNGQVGGRISEKEPNPVQIFASGASAVSVGYAHICAIVDGGLSCWGWNSSGQIGTGKASDAVLTPTRVFEHDVTAVAAGGMHTCAVVGGALLCWGDNLYGELGAANAGPLIPVRVFEAGATAVSAQAQDTCAIVRSALWCWGDNRYGQIGNGASGAQVSQPFKVFDRDVSAVAVGDGYACAIVAQALQCWGAIRDGIVGHSAKSEYWVLKPETKIARGVTAIAAGVGHICAVVDGALKCWGHSGSLRAGDRSVIKSPETIVAHGVAGVAAAEDFTCVLVDGALRCRGFNSYGAVLTVGRAASKPFDFADGDVQTIDRGAADAADARARLPGDVANWLVGRRITDGKLAYLVTRASGKVDKDFYDNDAWTRMSLDVVALYALDHKEPPPGDRGAASIDAAIPAGALCGRDIELRSRLDDNVRFLVLKDDRFVAVNTATDGELAKLAPMASGDLPERSLRLGADDLKKLDACANDALAHIEKQPLRGIGLYAADRLLTRVPATPDADWTNDTQLDAVSKIVIEPKNGSADDYTADVRVSSSMVCGGLTLANWKHGTSIAWQLARSGNSFESNREMLDKEDPQFPDYTAAELRSAIAEAKRLWQNDKPIDPFTCQAMLTDETYTIRKGNQIAQRITIGYGEPKPSVPLDCEGGNASFAMHVAADLGYYVSGWTPDGYMVCKAMPDAPGTTIVVLALQAQGSASDDSSSVSLYDLDVSIVDTKTRRVLARSVEKGAFTSDAWRFGGVQIDTGRYRLAENVRAFGVRATYGSSSRYSPAEDTTLILYIRDGRQLRSALDGLLVHSVRGETNDDCTSTSSSLDRTIDVAPTGNHGFVDLVVTSQVSDASDSDGDDGGDCKSVEHESETTRTTLRYDGRKYVIPEGSNQFP